MVADGYGHRGDVASRIAIDSVRNAIQNLPTSARGDRHEEYVTTCLAELTRQANSRVLQFAADHDCERLVGAAFAVLVLGDGRRNQASVLHAGTSRVYRIHGNRLSRLTRDHVNGARQMEQDGDEALEVALNARALGRDNKLSPEVTHIETSADDWFIVCSDGLTDALADADIARIVSGATDVEKVATALVWAANEAGGPDNISAIVIALSPAPIARKITSDEVISPAQRGGKADAWWLKYSWTPDHLTKHLGAEVFLSFKNLDRDGRETRECLMAKTVAVYLRRKGFTVFLSLDSLESLGKSAYMEAIEGALQTATVLIAVGTSAENLNSRWVKYEWHTFHQEIIEGYKRDGEIFSVIDGISERDLPLALRQRQAFRFTEEGLATLSRFLLRSLGKASSGT